MAPFLFAVTAAASAFSPVGASARFSAMPASPPSERASAWEWMRVGLLSANLLWTTLCLGGILPGTRVVTALLTAALVGVHVADPVSGARVHPAGMFFLPFLAYAAANAAWVTPVHWLGWTDWLNWTQAVAVFWVVLNGVSARSARQTLCWVLAALGVGAASLGAYQHFCRPDWLMLGRIQAQQFIGRSSGPFGIPNSLGVMMALLIPPAGAVLIARKGSAEMRILAGAVLAALLLGFGLAVSRGAWLALAGAVALRALLSPGRPLRRRLSGAAGARGVAGAAAALLYLSYPLMRVRVDQMGRDLGERTRPIIWRGAWRIFEAHPWVGGGAGSFDALFEGYRPLGYRDQPVYAHSDYLNTLSDYGGVGGALLFGAVGLLAWRCARSRGLAGAAFTGLLAFSLHLLVDFHLKIPALALLVATVAALVTLDAWPVRSLRPGRGGRAVGWAVGAAFVCQTLLGTVPKYRADEERRTAREGIDRLAAAAVDVAGEQATLASIRAELARAVELDRSNAQAWSDRAYADSLWALVEPAQTVELGRQVEAEGGRAVELSPVVAEFWIRRGAGFDMERKWPEGGDCFVRALELAPLRADVWYYQAYHLSLAPNERGPAMAAADVCLRLDPSFLLAQALRQRLAAQP